VYGAYTMNFTRRQKKARVKSRAKTANEDNPFSIFRARNCTTTLLDTHCITQLI
jgi:hypothetical protein